MGRPRKNTSDAGLTRPPAKTPDDRENQLIAAAIDLAEEQIRKGTATSQVISHFLKLGSTTAKLEKEKLSNEVELVKAKTANLKSAEHNEKLYKEAMDAFSLYRGGPKDE